MWLLLDKGFISVVEHKDDPSRLLVRARVAEDISRIFGEDVEVIENPTADYLYRAVVSRERLAYTLLNAVQALDYHSHVKEVAIERSAPAECRAEAYYSTWTAMSRLQSTRPYGGEWWGAACAPGRPRRTGPPPVCGIAPDPAPDSATLRRTLRP